jgi:hypothetical protein
MREFLVKDKKPIVKWGFIRPNTYFKGSIPEGYKLAVSPCDNYIVVDVDVNDDKNGFDNIPAAILTELSETLNYQTKNKGRHYWLKYTGDKPLANKTSGLGIDLRTNKGYVVWYHNVRIKDCLHEIKETSIEMNYWLEKLFSYV